MTPNQRKGFLLTLKRMLLTGVLASALVGCDAQTAEQGGQPCAYDKESYAYELATLILDPDDPDARVQFREELAAATRRGESAVGISRDYILVYGSALTLAVIDEFRQLMLGEHHPPLIVVSTGDKTLARAFYVADRRYKNIYPDNPPPRLSYVFYQPVVEGVPFGSKDAISQIRVPYLTRDDYALPTKGEWRSPFGICHFHDGKNEQGKASMFVLSASGDSLNCFIYSYLVSMGLRGPSLEDYPPTISLRSPHLLLSTIMVNATRFIYGKEKTLSEDERVQVGMDFCALYRAAEIWKPRIRI